MLQNNPSPSSHQTIWFFVRDIDRSQNQKPTKIIIAHRNQTGPEEEPNKAHSFARKENHRRRQRNQIRHFYMYMHIQKAQFPIGEETNPSPKPGTLRVQTEFNREIYTQFQTHFTVQIPQTTSSSPTNPSPKPIFNPESYTHFISDQRRPQIQTHLTVQIPQTASSSPTNRPTQFHHEPISHNSPTTQTLRSTPHKRPVMAQTPYPTPSSSRDRPQSALNSKSPFFPCSAALAISFFKKSLVLRCCRHICCARLLRFHLQFLFLLSLPSLYLFLSNPRRSYALDVLSLLAFASVILISLNVALPRLPSIRLFLARSLPIKFSSSPAAKPAKPVVWSIGSKPKSERHANSGSWVKVYSNGDVYEGEFHKGKCSGSGVYYYNMKGRYEGDWVDEKYDGYGVETWARGSRYRGQYRQGLRHGIGVYRFYTGDVYSGEWSNGQCHGCGVHTCEDGSRYVGEFKWGVKHGLGHYHFRNGDTYSGEYFADKMHGFGIYRFGNGHQYEGAWHEGRRQGLGMYTFRNGETQSGHWQNGVLNALSTQNPGSPYAVEHSKVLNVIQEAQQVAARARNLGGVDDRVNRAVAAANKAAHAARVAAIKAVQKQMHSNNYIDGIPIAF